MARLDVYMSTALYDHLKFNISLNKSRNAKHMYDLRLVRFYTDMDNGQIVHSFDFLKAINYADRLPNMPEIFPHEELDFIARYNLCRDYIAAYKSVKGFL
ncbi:hypothetical protein Presley_20 [Acinetobacter phage Presley]|uniref:Uncharacterized protein n=1 Tax=Acinetobacter phage Presley TaxID=1406780 RepID=U5PZM2_9CAUD|nr:hypothetical protein Presley_20 [Acinetobacter phage Presley]AGY48087.1 hypothetical protein Presley_20 [Acinetobacter phage Presley]